MKIKLHSYVFVFLLCLLWQGLSAQDRIFFVNGEILEARIQNITHNRIAYFDQVNGETVLKTIPLRKVRSVVFHDGTKTETLQLYKDPSLYINQRKRALKFHLFAPLLGHTTLSYEQNLWPGRGLEYSLGLIGLGDNNDVFNVRSTPFSNRTIRANQMGMHLGFGYKCYSKPAIGLLGRRYKHLLQGWYYMPKLLLGYYEKNVADNNSATGYNRYNIVFGNLMVYGGKQVVYGGSILLDWQLGLGLGINKENLDDQDELPAHYTVSMVSRFFAIGGGLRLGFLF